MPNYWADLTPNCRKMATFSKKMPFHHDNAPAHTSAFATAKLVELGNELRCLIHRILQIWSLATFFSFQTEKVIRRQKFESNEEVIAATEAYFADLQKTCFSNGLKKLEHHWVKCIELKGAMLRNKSPLLQNFHFSFVG